MQEYDIFYEINKIHSIDFKKINMIKKYSYNWIVIQLCKLLDNIINICDYTHFYINNKLKFYIVFNNMRGHYISTHLERLYMCKSIPLLTNIEIIDIVSYLLHTKIRNKKRFYNKYKYVIYNNNLLH